MTDEKRKPGRPRKWSSGAERMRAARAAKREERRIDEERRAARREQQERRMREKHSAAPATEPAASRAIGASEDLAECHAEIEKLTAEVRRLEDEYDDAIYDRWISETQYRMAIHRMQQHDPDGLRWLDNQLRRWAAQRSGGLEDRRRARRSWGTGHL